MHCSSHCPAGLTETLWTILPDPTRRMRDPCKHPDNAASAVWHFTFSDPLWQVRHLPQSRRLDAWECLNGGRFVVKGHRCKGGVILYTVGLLTFSSVGGPACSALCLNALSKRVRSGALGDSYTHREP